MASELPGTQTICERRIYCGKTADGEKVYAAIVLRKRLGEYDTVAHEKITDPYEFTVGYETWQPRARDFDSWTREAPHLSEYGDMSARDYASLRNIIPCHLNTMKAACEHQSVEGDKCPRGYVWGTKWLVKPLPQHIIGFVSDLCAESE